MENGYQIGKDAMAFFFGVIGVFDHNHFFTKKLWRKVDGFKDKDEAEVKCAFLCLWVHEKMGIPVYPSGCSWVFTEGSEEQFLAYMEEWTPVLEAFKYWFLTQR